MLIYKYTAENKTNCGIKCKAICDVNKTKILNRVGVELIPQISDECMKLGHFDGGSIVSKNYNAITDYTCRKKTMQQFIIPIA